MRITISFYKKLWAWDRFFFIPLKMSDDEMSIADLWNERFIRTEFLFSKNRQYKRVDLRQHVEKGPMIDVFQIDRNKIKLDHRFRIRYDNSPCDIGVRNFAAGIITGLHLKRNAYLQIMSIGLSDLTSKVFATIMNFYQMKRTRN